MRPQDHCGPGNDHTSRCLLGRSPSGPTTIETTAPEEHGLAVESEFPTSSISVAHPQPAWSHLLLRPSWGTRPASRCLCLRHSPLAVRHIFVLGVEHSLPGRAGSPRRSHCSAPLGWAGSPSHKTRSGDRDLDLSRWERRVPQHGKGRPLQRILSSPLEVLTL